MINQSQLYKQMKSFLQFRWKYHLHRIISLFKTPSKSNNYLFVTQEQDETWILGAKARRLALNFGENAVVKYSKDFKNLPIAPGYFFLHQKYYAKALRFNPHLKKAKSIVMFTHADWNKNYSKEHAHYTLKNAYKIICLNSNVASELESIGINKEKIVVYHMASDPNFFSPKPQKFGKTVGFCCYYSKRKNPELIFNLVRSMPEIDFILVGQNWENYPKIDQLRAAPNFKYYANEEYDAYPLLYQKMDVFVSPSFLEGGPVPLLEAMLTNLVPVASNTGFCPDIIEHGKNGFLFDPAEDSIEYISELIRSALKLDVNTRDYAIAHSWSSYGRKIHDLFAAGN